MVKVDLGELVWSNLGGAFGAGYVNLTGDMLLEDPGGGIPNCAYLGGQSDDDSNLIAILTAAPDHDGQPDMVQIDFTEVFCPSCNKYLGFIQHTSGSGEAQSEL